MRITFKGESRREKPIQRKGSKSVTSSKSSEGRDRGPRTEQPIDLVCQLLRPSATTFAPPQKPSGLRPRSPDWRLSRAQDLTLASSIPVCGSQLAVGGSRDYTAKWTVRPSDLVNRFALPHAFAPAAPVHAWEPWNVATVTDGARRKGKAIASCDSPGYFCFAT